MKFPGAPYHCLIARFSMGRRMEVLRGKHDTRRSVTGEYRAGLPGFHVSHLSVRMESRAPTAKGRARGGAGGGFPHLALNACCINKPNPSVRHRHPFRCQVHLLRFIWLLSYCLSVCCMIEYLLCKSGFTGVA